MPWLRKGKRHSMPSIRDFEGGGLIPPPVYTTVDAHSPTLLIRTQDRAPLSPRSPKERIFTDDVQLVSIHKIEENQHICNDNNNVYQYKTNNISTDNNINNLHNNGTDNQTSNHNNNLFVNKNQIDDGSQNRLVGNIFGDVDGNISYSRQTAHINSPLQGHVNPSSRRHSDNESDRTQRHNVSALPSPRRHSLESSLLGVLHSPSMGPLSSSFESIPEHTELCDGGVKKSTPFGGRGKEDGNDYVFATHQCTLMAPPKSILRSPNNRTQSIPRLSFDDVDDDDNDVIVESSAARHFTYEGRESELANNVTDHALDNNVIHDDCINMDSQLRLMNLSDIHSTNSDEVGEENNNSSPSCAEDQQKKQYFLEEDLPEEEINLLRSCLSRKRLSLDSQLTSVRTNQQDGNHLGLRPRGMSESKSTPPSPRLSTIDENIGNTAGKFTASSTLDSPENSSENGEFPVIEKRKSISWASELERVHEFPRQKRRSSLFSMFSR